MIWQPTKDSRIKKRDGVYWARFMKKGRRVEQSLETKSFELAKRQVDDIEAKMLVGRSWKKERELFKDAWVQFLIDKREGNRVKPARERTLKDYAWSGTKYFIPFFENYRLGDIDSEVWEQFIAYVQQESDGTLFFSLRKHFNHFLTWAKRHDKLSVTPYLRDPDAKGNKEKEAPTPGKAYTLDELARLLKASKSHGKFHLWMLMSIYMGMRPGEICALSRDRIDLEEGVINLKRADTKTGKARRVPIHPKVMLALAERMAATRDREHLFPNLHDKTRAMSPQGFKKVWYAIAEKAKVDGRPYDFRHTFITHAIAQGLNPAAVGMITGTSLEMIEKVYLHLSNDDLKKITQRFEVSGTILGKTAVKTTREAIKWCARGDSNA